jgi:myo-inositol-1(or 4)-monophosphatase
MTAIGADTTVPTVKPNNEDGPEGEQRSVDPHDADAVLSLFGSICDRTARILGTNDDWSMSGGRATQYAIDVEIDRVCLDMLHGSGLSVLSEESGITRPAGSDESEAMVVVDPLDGSTNASLGLPWCATALCLVVDGSPSVAMVTNLRTGERFTAVVGRGATQNGRVITVGEAPLLADAIVAVNARPPDGFRPSQYRSMGATALDIASVAGGAGFDGSIDFDDDKIGVWDYLAAVTILREAGGVAADALGRDLMTLDHRARRRPVSAASPALLEELIAHI